MRSMLDTPPAIASMIMLVVVGAMFFLLMPMYIGALADFAHFDNEQIGNLTFFELIGVALASLTSLFWIRRADWRYGVVIACIGLMAANGLSLLDHEFNWLAAVRVLAGLSEGALLCIAYAALGDTKEVDRNFGYGVIAQILAPAVFFVLLPGWFEQYELNAIFYVQIGCAALALVTVISLPASGIQRDAEGGGQTARLVVGVELHHLGSQRRVACQLAKVASRILLDLERSEELGVEVLGREAEAATPIALDDRRHVARTELPHGTLHAADAVVVAGERQRPGARALVVVAQQACRSVRGREGVHAFVDHIVNA